MNVYVDNYCTLACLSRSIAEPESGSKSGTYFLITCIFRETVGASRYADRIIITGTLQELIDGAELFLSRYIAVGARVEGFKRIDIPEYSLEVLREAVINAVVHRDYSKRGESVRVFCYPDRVEQPLRAARAFLRCPRQ